MPLLSTHFFYEKKTEIHSHNIRGHIYNFYMPKVNNKLSQNTFFYKTIKDWNELPSEIKMVKNSITFKKLVNKFIFAKEKSIHENPCIYY